MFAFGAAGSKLFHGLGSWQEVLTQEQTKLVDDAPSAEIFSSFYVHEYFSLHHTKLHEARSCQSLNPRLHQRLAEELAEGCLPSL